MLLTRIDVTNVRNLAATSLPELARVNVLHGENGSGKTSILEAVHLLLTGRSFRNHLLKPLLRRGESQCVVFGETADSQRQRHTLGISKSADGSTIVKRDGERVATQSELMRFLPVQILHGESFELLLAGPALRRDYLDWVLFHVEPKFLSAWRNAQRALRQRNTLIRHDKIDRSQVLLWSREYLNYGLVVDGYRRRLVDELAPMINGILAGLSPDLASQLTLSYQQGWAKDRTLEEVLTEERLEKDIEAGYTRSGPHRADLLASVDGRTASDLLSRGQLKLVCAALRLAQTQALVDKGLPCLLLVDDLPAELDQRHRDRLCGLLEKLGQQVLITTIDAQEFAESWRQPDQVRMFHVEQGRVTAQASGAGVPPFQGIPNEPGT